MMEGADTKTYFSENTASFPKPINSKLKTEEFLKACVNLLNLLEKLGKVFAFPRRDMSGNIDKITKKFDEDHIKYEYLEDMVLIEKEQGILFATDALMWLRRGLHFVLETFEAVINDVTCQEDLTELVNMAYKKTLEKHHGWFGSNLFKVLLRLFPQRKSIIKLMALEKDNCDEFVLKDLKLYTGDLRICIEHLVEFYKKNGLESEIKA